jgi:predicted TIM-barrel fold metal-dependent hydrolase
MMTASPWRALIRDSRGAYPSLLKDPTWRSRGDLAATKETATMTVAEPARLTFRDVLIVDTDVHAHDLPGELAPYADAPWRPVLERVAAAPSRYLDAPGFAPFNTPKYLGGALPGLGTARTQIVYDAAQMRRELDEFSIDVGVVFPDHLLRLAALPNAAYAVATTQAYHRWLKERWLGADNDLYGVIVATPQDPEASVREIDRWAGDERFAGIYLPTCQAYPLWGNRAFDGIYERAQHYDLPVLLHAVAGLGSGFPYNLEQFATGIPAHTVSHVFAMMANLLSMMEHGLPVRYPRLRVCFCESGLSWVPFLRMRLDKEYNEGRAAWPHFADRPSRYMRAFYFATQPVEEPERREDLTDLIRIYDGEDRTVFASDWPHHDFDHPRAVFDLPMSDAMKRKVMGTNALALMPRIKVPAKYAV